MATQIPFCKHYIKQFSLLAALFLSSIGAIESASSNQDKLADNPISEEIPLIPNDIQLRPIAHDFTAPLGGAVAPIASLESFLFITDQVGLIWRVNVDNGEKSIFIDVKDKIIALGKSSPGGYDERGLLGFAFHPDYENNGLTYLYTSQTADKKADFSTLEEHKANHQSVLIELKVSKESRLTSAAIIKQERELLRIDQPQYNHNGGALAFGPDQMLYVSIGDGGKSDDQGVGHSEIGNASDPSNPLGSILRIDPLSKNSKNQQYGTPSDNPFIAPDNAALPEIYAYGLRNPWKMSFNPQGQLLVADVGQNHIEEINLVTKGGHYGWPFREGSFWFDKNGNGRGRVTNTKPANLTHDIEFIDPLFQYDHDEGISITGGYAYQGNKISTFKEQYVFADFRGRIFLGDLKKKTLGHLGLETNLLIFSFAEDAKGELYIMGNANASTSGNTGKLLKFTTPK